MTTTKSRQSSPIVDDATITRWWVQLNCWAWPDDLPGRPIHESKVRDATRGAFAVVNALAVERGLLVDGGPIDTLWRDEPRRRALVALVRP